MFGAVNLPVLSNEQRVQVQLFIPFFQNTQFVILFILRNFYSGGEPLPQGQNGREEAGSRSHYCKHKQGELTEEPWIQIVSTEFKVICSHNCKHKQGEPGEIQNNGFK